MVDKVRATPKGFRQVCRSEFPESWNFVECDTVEGYVLAVKTAILTRKKRQVEVKFVELGVGEEVYTVWESAGLQDFFREVKSDDYVLIVYEGEKDMGPGLNPLKMYSGYIREDDNVEE